MHLLIRGTQSWRRLLTAGSPGGTELLSPCWEQGEPVLYVLALTYVHADSRRLEATLPCQRGNKEGKRLQELKNEGRQGGWIQGMESPGQKWMYYGTVSRPAARFCHFK